MTPMNILAVTTLYYPAPAVADNLATYASDVDALLLWDNTPGGSDLTLPEDVRQKVIRIRKGPNAGIGPALNEAVRLCREQGFTHLLTMDQDSAFAAGSFPAYKAQAAAGTDRRPVVYIPRVNRPAEQAAPAEAPGFILSGSLFPRHTLDRVGLFEERLVIDGIDVEYGYRLLRAGGHIVQIAQGSLRHALGYPLSRRILWWKPVSLNYSPLRVYYIARAFLYLQRAYPEYVNRRLVRKLVWMRPLYILLMERQKGAKLRAWILGVCHGWRGHLERDAYAKRMNP